MQKNCKNKRDDWNKKIDLMIKIIIRTDSYLNSANTKSTILLSLSSALIVAICVNFSTIILFLITEMDKRIASTLLSIILIFLILSVVFSLHGITPFLKPSKQSNTFSFVDVDHYYKDLSEYKRSFTKINEIEYINQLIFLNHNLSIALVRKYKKQIIAINLISLAMILICFLIFFIVLSNY